MSDIRPFEPTKLPFPWRGVLEREVSKLKARNDVVAVGVCGSLAYDDIWPGSDLDIEVVVKGDKPKELITTEQEVSVDYGYFGENQLSGIPCDTRPVHDPSGILTRELGSRSAGARCPASSNPEMLGLGRKRPLPGSLLGSCMGYHYLTILGRNLHSVGRF